MDLVRNSVIRLIASIFFIGGCATWNISLVPESAYDDAADNCTSGVDRTLMPLPVLLDVNMSVIIEVLDVNETAWIGGVSYKEGCVNTTTVYDDTGECSDIVHQKFQTNTKLNFSCVFVGNLSDVRELFKSSRAKTLDDSLADCNLFGDKVKLPEVNDKYLHYHIPKEIRKADRGPQWFGDVDNSSMKGRMDRTCRFVTKIDECTLRIKSGGCNIPKRKGLCYHDPDITFHSTLEFIQYDAQTGNTFDVARIIEDQSVCSVSKTDPINKSRAGASTENVTTDSITIRNTEQDFITPETTQIGETTSYLQTKGVETSSEILYTSITQKGEIESSSKPREQTDASNNSWISMVAIVLIITLVASIVAVIVVITKKRGRNFFVTRSDEEKDTHIMQISDPVLEEVEPEDIEIIDLDDDNKEPVNSNGDAIQRISVRSDDGNTSQLVFIETSNKNEHQTTNDTIT